MLVRRGICLDIEVQAPAHPRPLVFQYHVPPLDFFSISESGKQSLLLPLITATP